MVVVSEKIDMTEFQKERKEVLETWSTGRMIDLTEGIEFQKNLSESKRFSLVMKNAQENGLLLLQPRAGVALVDEHIKLLGQLENYCDLLPTTIDAYTRQNRYQDAERGIERSVKSGQSMLNGFPAVNHGLEACRRVVQAVNKPLEVRHGTPDARLLAEITLAGGFTAFEGGGISYNIPYAKKVPLETSIRHWQYVDRLVGFYQEERIAINREPFGPLSGTLIPPFISHAVAILEGLLALEQGVVSLTLGYGQLGNLIQDVAAIRSLRELADEYFQRFGYTNYELTTVLHQWMGGFPEKETQAYSVIAWGGAVAALSGATKVIIKTPHEASGIPTCEANIQGLEATRQITNMLKDQHLPDSRELSIEIEIIKQEVRAVLDSVFDLGQGNVAEGAVRAFQAGVIDVPFSPSIYNKGKMLSIRDNAGAIRVLEKAEVPLPESVYKYHADKIQQRACAEGREPCFQMVVDDIYAISKGRLVGRPR